jgi:hypothetical protein
MIPTIKTPSYFEDQENNLKSVMMESIRLMLYTTENERVDVDGDEPVEYINEDNDVISGYLRSVVLIPTGDDDREVRVEIEDFWATNQDTELTIEQPYQFMRDVYQKIYEVLN